MHSDPEAPGKKTRRRLRLSCVECTKRRQKCDRNQPCTLCVSRGVAHLCRWENVPVARPTPVRPPGYDDTSASSSAVGETREVEELKLRIAILEDELTIARGSPSGYPGPDSMLLRSAGSSTSMSQMDSNVLGGEVAFYGGLQPQAASGSGYLRPFLGPSTSTDPSSYHTASGVSAMPIFPRQSAARQIPEQDVQITTSNVLASLAHQGEFVGPTSLFSYIISASSGRMSRLLYAQSTDPLRPYRENTSSFPKFPNISSVEGLLSYIPSPDISDILVTAYLSEMNWRYGIPEDWFRRTGKQMYDVVAQMRRAMHTTGNIVGMPQVNPNWLALFFAILACAPPTAYVRVRGANIGSSGDFFALALVARHIAEDEYMTGAPPSSMDGTLQSCFAVPLLADYMAQRGKIGEAWKLVSKAVADALAIGMHKDPEWGIWQTMSVEERLLRRRGWWALFAADKVYSLILGRPQMIGRGITNVQTDRRESLGRLVEGQVVIVSLMQLLEEVIDTCFKNSTPTCAISLAFDRKFQRWEENLPPEYQMKIDRRLLQHMHPSDQTVLYRQRFFIHTWYLIGRQKVHLASTFGLGGPIQPQEDIEACLTSSISASLRLVRYQTAAYHDASRSSSSRGGGHLQDLGQFWFFDGCYGLFEGTVALLTTMALYPWGEKMDETRSVIGNAVDVFRAVTMQEKGKFGETAARALDVLSVIRELPWGQDVVSMQGL